MRKNAQVYHKPSPFEKAPDLVPLVAEAIAQAAEIEAHVGTLFVAMLGASAAPAAAMVQSLTSAAGARAAMGAAAETVLDEESLDLFDIIMDLVRVATKVRNTFAHCTWAWSPDVPDAMLFIEQSARMELNIAIQAAQGRAKLGELYGPLEGIKFDPAKIWVYRKSDLVEANERLSRALHYVVTFRVVVSFKRRGAAGHSLGYELLSAEPEISEALSRLHTRRQKSASARPARRRKGRTEG